MTLNQKKRFALLRAIYRDTSTAELAITRELEKQRADDHLHSRIEEEARRDVAIQTILRRFGVNVSRALYPNRTESYATVVHLSGRGIDLKTLMREVEAAHAAPDQRA